MTKSTLLVAPLPWVRPNGWRRTSKFITGAALALGGALSVAFAQGAANPASPAATAAQPKRDVVIQLTQQKVTRAADGKEVLVEASRILPGEVIEYRANYKNEGKNGVKQLLATLPVPAGMELVSETAAPVGAQASLGDGKYAPIPLKRKVRQPNGAEIEVLVPLAEYRSLRWSLGDLAVGQAQVVTARMRVSDAPTPVSVKVDADKGSAAKK